MRDDIRWIFDRKTCADSSENAGRMDFRGRNIAVTSNIPTSACARNRRIMSTVPSAFIISGGYVARKNSDTIGVPGGTAFAEVSKTGLTRVTAYVPTQAIRDSLLRVWSDNLMTVR